MIEKKMIASAHYRIQYSLSRIEHSGMKGLSDQLLIVVSLFLILGNDGADGQADILENYRRVVSVFNSFDRFFHNVRVDPDYLRKIEPRGSDYANLLLGYHMAETAEEAAELGYDTAEECEIRDHYNYMMSNDLRNTPQTQSFVNIFAAYSSFWASINFKICSLIYERIDTSLTSDETKIRTRNSNRCLYLYRYLHWYTFLEMQKKVFDFRADLGEAVKSKIIGVTYEWLFKSKTKSRTTVESVYPILASMDLRLILDTTYLYSGFPYLTRGEFEHKLLDVEKINAEYGPLLTETNCNDTDNNIDTCSIFKRSRGEAVIPIAGDKEYYHYLYKKVLSMFRENELILIENYFSLVLTGKTTKSEISDFIPPYELSENYWNSLELLEEIKNLDTDRPRKMYNLDGSDKIFRSNPTEILRQLERIKTSYYYHIKQTEGSGIPLEGLEKQLDILTEDAKFALKKAAADHVVDYIFENSV